MQFRAVEYNEVPSTNGLVKNAIDSGEPEGLVVCARVQTAGYGRQGRKWRSPEGGMYASFLLRPENNMSALPTLSLVMGCAVRSAIAEFAKDPNCIKVIWPNDVVLSADSERERTKSAAFNKICGISLEKHGGGVCVGIGVNVTPVEGVEVGGKNKAAYVEDFAANPSSCSVEAVRDAVLHYVGCAHSEWYEDGFSPFVKEYNEHSALIGRHISVLRADGTEIVKGTAGSVDASGALHVCTAHSIYVPVATGEVHIEC